MLSVVETDEGRDAIVPDERLTRAGADGSLPALAETWFGTA
ncbi:hypothetical protein [Streptomyces sp. NPDC050287]